MLRNKEFRQFIMVLLLMAAVTVTLGFMISMEAGILVLSSASVFGAAFFIFTKARYKNIARISNQIDLVLHKEERLFIEEADEGELSILQSEITKMTLRIREQNEALKKEKEHLADSLADIAHQLRTPLTSVNLTLSLLERASDTNERKAFLLQTEGLLARMDWLLTSLLKLSRLDAGVVEFQSSPVEVNDMIQIALRPLLIPMDLHAIDLKIDVTKGIEILGDANWLAEALENILKNCMESVGENGTIEIIGRDNPLLTEIIIHDSGAGFERQDFPCLFDRFYRGESTNAAGYGIGLALCKVIITRQGGTITARNHPQGGALFTIRFPK